MVVFMAQTVNKKKKKLMEYGFIFSILAYPLALFLIMYVYVNINSFAMAFQKSTLKGQKTFVGMDNFQEFFDMIFSDGGILSISMINSVKMYLINFAICMPLYIFFAYLFFKKVPGTKWMRAVILVPQVISSMVMALLFKKLVDDALPDLMIKIFDLKSFPVLLNTKDYAFGTTLFYMIWSSFGTSVIVYGNAMNEIDGEVIESAKLDGIDNMFLELWYIILPLIYPTLTTFIVSGFATFLMTSGPIMTFYYSAAPDYVYNFGYYYSVQIMNGNSATYNMLAAGGLVLSLIIAPLTHLLKHCMEKFGPEAA
jgi:ABC-type sugar transport system permease subunit